MKFFLSAAFALLLIGANAQTSITCDSVLQTSTCAGGNVIIPFQTTGSFPWGNVFTAQISDGWGNWTAPQNLGTTFITLNGSGIIYGTFPSTLNFGFLYRIRVISSNPADTSTDSPNTIVITQVAQLNQVIASPNDSACPGDTVNLYVLNPGASYAWSTGDTTQQISITTSGVYSVTTTDFLGCQVTSSDTITFDPSFCTGIEENVVADMFTITPNPAQQEVTLNLNTQNESGNVTVSDVSGRLIYSQSIAAGSAAVRLDVQNFAAGIYTVVVRLGNETGVQKLIKE
ncbi:MAG: T9SS type A sorting domain-containing protein [Bacteroidia bacterium]|nr:T9SS type A sorting domain-containing protein [Bacteroidia bacterium]